jgi:hypothetical protein
VWQRSQSQQRRSRIIALTEGALYIKIKNPVGNVYNMDKAGVLSSANAYFVNDK